MINWKRLAFNFGLLVFSIVLPIAIICGLTQIVAVSRDNGWPVALGLIGVLGVFGIGACFYNLMEGDLFLNWLKGAYKQPKKPEPKADSNPVQADWR